MKNKNPFQWFNEFQNDINPEDGIKLYEALIKEEQNEFMEALKNRDIIEMYDAIADIIWVKAGAYYFMEKVHGEPVSTNNPKLGEIEWKGYFTYQAEKYSLFNLDCVLECLNEVSRSNFTKSKQKQTEGEKIGKIIKGPNYSKPNLEPILRKYGII